jgi:Domain of unknown function (DUF6316)
MTEKRSNDKDTHRPDQMHRASRGYEINNQWYFELRDGGQKGPFETREAMQTELNEFINLHEEMNKQY